jgi:uncharacterized protein (TIGR02246 family)
MLTLLCLLCSFGSLLGAQAAPTAARSPDEAAIRDLVQQYVNAREHQDAAAVEALFTADADQLVSSGEWRNGRAAVVRGAIASSQRTGGKRSIEVTSIRFLTPDVAIADGRYTLTNMTGGGNRDMWTTLVVKRESGAWRIAAIRNMLPAAPAGG